MISIDGTQYPAICPDEITRTSTFRDKFLEPTMDGTIQRELVGVYFSYTIHCGFEGNTTEYNAFWNDINRAIDFRMVRVPHGDGYIEFQAYFEGTEDTIALHDFDGKNYYSDFSITFISRAPNTTPY